MANAIFELAKTGRSKCATTGQVIAEGSPRIGFEIWRVGRRCMTYQTPKAFLKNLAIAAADDNRSKCKFSQTPIKQGDLCLGLAVGGAKGESPTMQVCLLSKVAPIIKQAIGCVPGKLSLGKVRGFGALSPGDKKKVSNTLLKGKLDSVTSLKTRSVASMKVAKKTKRS